MQLSARAVVAVALAALAFALAFGPPPAARADGELSFATAYYKERATRVMQPMLDARFDVGESGEATGHMLVDAITSASVGVGGELFEEKRVEGGATYTHEIDLYKIGGLVRYSTEPDYKSLFGGVRLQAELFDRNLTITAAGMVGHDDFDNSGAGPTAPRREGELDTMLGSIGLAQLLSPNTVASVTYDVSKLEGEQANLYRFIITAGMQVDEKHPRSRLRHAVAGTVKQFLPRSVTTLMGTYRFYHDDWDITAHTPEARVIQDVGDGSLFAVRYRYHRQSKAYFFEDDYAMPMDLISEDEKLSAFTSHTIGASFEMSGHVIGFTGTLGETRGQIVIEYVDQNNRFGNAIAAHASLTVPITY
ncbi:MAG: DUF3570 domain-containing protein [Deltaproteobacteria bacterium]|nr:DUF3570 domain-containing protein [Kofleriaceae bacterium]